MISNFHDYVEDDTVEHIHVLPDDYLVDTPLGRVSEDKGFEHVRGTNARFLQRNWTESS